MPGKLSYFDRSGASLGVDSFAFPGAETITQATNAGASPTKLNQFFFPAIHIILTGDLYHALTHSYIRLGTVLGLNLYTKEKTAAPSAAEADVAHHGKSKITIKVR